MKEKLVVVGNGMAGMRTLEELLKRAPDKYDITVFGSEPRLNYNRIMLSPLLAGEKAFEDIILNDWDWYEANNITLRAGDPIVGINPAKKTVISGRGRELEYDKLLLATGSEPIIIPVPGHTKEGVITFRDMGDVDHMISASKTRQNAVVIGGGLLGLEAAYGLSTLGMRVTVLHLADHLMERQLDSAAGNLLKNELGQRDIHVVTGADTAEILGEERVEAVKLKDGRSFDADLVVMAVGIRPNTWLAKSHGIETGRGIKVDDHMVTSDPDILSVGECVEHRGLCYGLVAPIWDMAKVLADKLAGIENPGYTGSVLSTKLKVTGIDLFSAGDFQGGKDVEDIVFRDAARGVYKRVCIRDNKVIGTVLYGDTADGPWYFQLLKDEADISDVRSTMIFGQGFEEGQAADPFKAVAALSDDAEICGCNGVSKGDIVSAIKGEGLTSLDEVKTCTKASASCGSCTGLVERLIGFTLGDEFVADDGPKPMCGCTHLPHDDVRRLIKAKELKTIPDLYQALEWTTPDGCSSCRPAVNYYLLSAWPGEYVDDARSRFINERVHANIQKDGTYSVVPRMWGGLTSAKELRAIADVVDKFDIPTVKVTGGQRIDLFGVKKDDLPAVWADLGAAGMVSGHAYGKSLRTVKTCVGSDWCRFGTQDSTGLGVKLEEETWGSWMPHKFKMAVSGCPRNCAEATIKDFGVVCVDSGYELHVGGNGGIHVRATDLLTKVATEEEAIEYAMAFVQLYREEARYLERTAPWIERVGLEYVQDRLMRSDEERLELRDRFLKSQEGAQVDPWAERAKGVDAHEFQALPSPKQLATVE
ncbi:nitrite reductase large subunit NirB [Kordiimonas lacus]|uniref:Nitrite reductase (NADH) large subunit n=1 Tax=Kordiimonas lacus TaxID=637679 RepID=A0A1G6YPP4_9PROT|nr:nitrite reductase large subunit NirB [Kordiimonas lacus]SDD92280.1 nitrite reductase (NADH) large subunit [Kordiimonas lacus]